VNQNKFGTCPGVTNVNFDSNTWRAGAQYQFSANNNAYATVSTGFKSGGVSLSKCRDTFEPEKVTSYELGYKGRFVDRRVSLSAAVFSYDYKDLQLSQTFSVNGALVIDLINVPAATIRGAEMELRVEPFERVSFDLSTSYLDAHYKNFFNIDALRPTLGLQDLSGNRLNNAPRWSGTAGVEYKAPLGGQLGTLTARVDAYATAQYFMREYNDPLDGQAGYVISNGYLSWQSSSGQYSARLWGKNLGNRAYIQGIQGNALYAARGGRWNEPRQIGLDMRWDF
jgi:iron complex outermembrane receptor protein